MKMLRSLLQASCLGVCMVAAAGWADGMEPVPGSAENPFFKAEEGAGPAPAAAPTKPAEPVAPVAPAASTLDLKIDTGSIQVHQPKVSTVPQPGVALRFDNADIYEVVQTILGDILKLNFIMDPGATGKVTINTSGTVSQADIYSILERILQMNGLSLVREGGLYKIIRDANAPRDALGFEAAGNGSPVIQIIPLKFVQASGLINVLRNFVGPQAAIFNDPTNRYVIVADRVANIQKLVEIVKTLDVDYLREVKIDFMRLERSDAVELAREMETLFKQSGMFNWPGTEGNKVFFMPITRMNGVLVAAANEDILAAARKWLKLLDGEQQDVASRVRIHHVQNTQATHLADILRQLFGGAPAAPRADKVVIGGAVPAAGGAGLSGAVQIIPDEATNTLVIKANPQDYLLIKQVIDNIDKVPRQVLIQVMVAEVTLNDETKFGVEWWLKNAKTKIGGDLYPAQLKLDSGLVAPTASTITGDLAKGVSSGLNYMLLDGAGDVIGLVNALSTTTDINLLSAPHVLASDGKEAKIEVGSDEPVVTQTVSTPTAATSATGTTTSLSTSNSVQYRPTGILLSVKPNVNESGLVTLVLSQEVSNRGNSVLVGGQEYPSFSKRKVNTEVTLQEGRSLLVAGLIQDKANNSDTGIPLLKDIPGLGYLFGATGKSRQKTELIITLTPYVVRTREEGERVTESFKRSLQELKGVMKKADETLAKGK
ncbi:MAG: type II secretion system secretin GspD [Betaproteobacteria bacterium]|nr:type II secretion system secretin GspD [Betaproteobacteria bacterium]